MGAKKLIPLQERADGRGSQTSSNYRRQAVSRLQVSAFETLISDKPVKIDAGPARESVATPHSHSTQYRGIGSRISGNLREDIVVIMSCTGVPREHSL
jgi:hypothetical protein